MLGFLNARPTQYRPQACAALAALIVAVASRRGRSGGIEVAVKVWSPVAPPGQAAACLVDIVEIDLGHQELRSIHRRLLHDASPEGIDDGAHADVTAAILVANAIGGDHEHAIVEGARLQWQIPDGNAVV